MTLSSLGVVKRRRSQNKPGAENQRAEAAMSREKYCSQRQQDLLEKKIVFMGHIITAEGILPDPAKV